VRKANYQLEDVRNTEKYLERMQQQPFNYRGVLTQVEPLRLENLWQLFLEQLEA